MQVVRFLPQHLRALRLQAAQQDMRAVLRQPGYGEALALAGPCFTAMQGHPVACGGAIEFHPGRAEIWGLLSDECAPFMRQMTRAILGWIGQCTYARLEINVATDFAAGHRWATMLGFQVEGPEKLAFSPSGGGAIPYVRLR